MNIKTRDFGEVQIDESTILDFASGIIGFEDVKRYTLISPLGEGKFPMWLQSVEDEQPCFVVYDPMEIYPDYKFQISDEEMEMLKMTADTPYKCLTVAIVPDDYRKTTINLRCPIVINLKDNVAAQVILTEHYEFKAPVYAEED
ncbi:MAG: flagellar assembly protein FliW [Oscillospiraceae bacterium]|nr:flagellar assembly protein FliW [Oscillospiraceae bacterium]